MDKRHVPEKKATGFEDGGLPCFRAVLEGAVHDANNFLHALLASASIAKQDLGAAHPVQAKLEMIEKCAFRVIALLRKLSAFSRPEARKAQPVDLNGLLRDAERVLHSILPESQRVEVRLSKEPVWVMADALDLLKVILEVCAEDSAASTASNTVELSLGPGETRESSCVHLRVAGSPVRASYLRGYAAEALERSGGKVELRAAPEGRVELGLIIPLAGDSELARELSGGERKTGAPEAVCEALLEMIRHFDGVVSQVSSPPLKAGERVERKW